MSEMEGIICDMEFRMTWDTYSFAKGSKILKKKDNEYSYVVVSYPWMPWPMSSREFITDSTFLRDFPEQGAITLFSYSLDEHPEVPVNPKILRVDQPWEIYVFEPEGNDIRVAISAKIDIKGSIPEWLLTSSLSTETRDYFKMVETTALKAYKAKSK